VSCWMASKKESTVNNRTVAGSSDLALDCCESMIYKEKEKNIVQFKVNEFLACGVRKSEVTLSPCALSTFTVFYYESC
jgi:hypothetical protein